MRNNIILGNNETGERIYLTSKNKRNTPDRLQLRSIHRSCASAWFSPKLSNYSMTSSVYIASYQCLSLVGRDIFCLLRLLMSHHWHNIIVNMSKLLGWPFFNMLKLLIVSV